MYCILLSQPLRPPKTGLSFPVNLNTIFCFFLESPSFQVISSHLLFWSTTQVCKIMIMIKTLQGYSQSTNQLLQTFSCFIFLCEPSPRTSLVQQMFFSLWFWQNSFLNYNAHRQHRFMKPTKLVVPYLHHHSFFFITEKILLQNLTNDGIILVVPPLLNHTHFLSKYYFLFYLQLFCYFLYTTFFISSL